MKQGVLDRLVDVAVREAFAHEAHEFTPWLAENLERLGETVGFNLELVRTEAAVEAFSADIHARCPEDGSTVLIENQLCGSDHAHLGQILTYLAGLEANRVIWVATNFREEHLSAIKWLNDHTPSEYAFFAVKLRVVRIADSPLATLFEVVEQPNKWERQLNESARTAEAVNPHTNNRHKFWTRYDALYPESANDMGGGRGSNKWRRVMDGQGLISYYLAQGQVGLFLRPGKGVSDDELVGIIEPHARALEKQLGVVADPYPAERRYCDYTNENEFAAIASWLHERVKSYAAALNEMTGAEA